MTAQMSIELIEKLLAEATPAPWVAEPMTNERWVVKSNIGMWVEVHQGPKTAALIAAAPTALRYLLDRVKELDQKRNHAVAGTIESWSEIDELREKLAQSEAEVARLKSVLELIATPKRADGTYNRDREACELLAREALAHSQKAEEGKK